MNQTLGGVSTVAATLAIHLVFTACLSAQDSKIIAPGPRKNPEARIAIEDVGTGSTNGTAANPSWHEGAPELPPGDSGFSSSLETSKADDASRADADLPDDPSVSLMASAQAQQSPSKPSENSPNAPVPQKTEPSLSDLGFSKSETEANVKEQALLDKRTHMLKIHQRMGLITTIPMVASVVTSLGAGGRNTGTASRDLHVALGALTGDLYGITAYYAIRAPRIKGTKKRGPIKFHEAMAWIHGPGMIATPILGAIAFSQKNNGQKVHGIAQAHGPVAIVTAGAFGAALLSVSFKF